MRIDPPPSPPVATGTTPAATAADDPPLEPPGVRARFHGFRVVPNRWFFVNAVEPNSGRFVLPIGMAPAARARATCVESRSATLVRSGCEPYVVGKPPRSSSSLIPNGTPARG